MVLKKLNLRNFRNYDSLKIEFNRKITILIGQNGQGKTNIIESIFLAFQGFSFRPVKTTHLIKNKKTKSLIEVFYSLNTTENTFSLTLEENKKTKLFNGKPTKKNPIVPIVIFSPESLASLKNGPESRRSLIDESLQFLFPKERETINKFNSLLRQRNSLLKDLKKEGKKTESKLKVLDSLNFSYLKWSSYLVIQRNRVIKLLEEEILRNYQYFEFEEKVNLDINSILSSQSTIDWDLKQVYDYHLLKEQEVRSVEMTLGVSLLGAHKQNIQFCISGYESKYYSSQGQQRVLILAYKIAEIKVYKKLYGEFPLLLLDDVLSELDGTKRKQFMEFLSSIDSQVLLTTTDFDYPVIDLEQLDILFIQNGMIQQ